MNSIRNGLVIFLLLAMSKSVFADDIQNRIAEACGEKSCEYIYKEMRKFAKNGSPHAQATLALLYKGGFGTDMDKDLSVKYIKRAAKNGLAFAEYKLGILYREGQLVEQDNEQADYWIRRSAKAGYNLAIDLLVSENKISKEEVKSYREEAREVVIEEGEEVLTITADKYTLTDLHDLLKARGYGNSTQTGSRIKGLGCSNSASPCATWNVNSAVGRSEFNSMISRLNAVATAIEMSGRGG